MKKVLTAYLCLLFIVAQVNAQIPAQITCPQGDSLLPFSCEDGYFYQLSAKTKMYTYNADEGGFGKEFNVTSVNAIGYNVLDDYIYGIERGEDTLIKIGACGDRNLGAISSLPDIGGAGYYVGDFDDQGNLYVTTANMPKVYKVNVATIAAVEISVGENVRASDFSFDPETGEFFFLNKDTGYLNSWKPNGTTSTVTSYLAPNTNTSSCTGYGATYIDGNRILYSYCNATGALDSIDLKTLVDGYYNIDVADSNTSVINNQNDGASCPTSITPPYCCSGTNLVQNPGFSDNTGFTNDYTYDAAATDLDPYEYTIADSIKAADICDNWNIVESTDCNEAGNFLLVNGLTSQPTDANNAIWSQTFTGLDVNASYKFCAKFRHLANSCHDIAPQIRVTSGSFTSAWVEIITIDTDECDWFLFDTTFNVASTTQEVSIELKQTVYKDGNDLAVDDLGFFEDCNSSNSNKTKTKTGTTKLETAPDKTKDIGKMNIQPNPGTDYVVATFDNVDKAGTLNLTDINGKMILSIEKKQGQVSQKILLDKLPVGLYILRLDLGGEFISKKIIKH